MVAFVLQPSEFKLARRLNTRVLVRGCDIYLYEFDESNLTWREKLDKRVPKTPTHVSVSSIDAFCKIPIRTAFLIRESLGDMQDTGRDEEAL